MSKVFEDEFMELQSGLISLCLEVTRGKVDKIFAYGSNEKKSKSFNAFFEVNGEIITLGKSDVPRELAFRFLKIGTEDIQKLDDLGAKYNRPVPTELKLYYDVVTKKFWADYKYEAVCGATTGKSAGEVFMEWVDEMKAQTKH